MPVFTPSSQHIRGTADFSIAALYPVVVALVISLAVLLDQALPNISILGLATVFSNATENIWLPPMSSWVALSSLVLILLFFISTPRHSGITRFLAVVPIALIITVLSMTWLYRPASVVDTPLTELALWRDRCSAIEIALLTATTLVNSAETQAIRKYAPWLAMTALGIATISSVIWLSPDDDSPQMIALMGPSSATTLIAISVGFVLHYGRITREMDARENNHIYHTEDHWKWILTLAPVVPGAVLLLESWSLGDSHLQSHIITTFFLCLELACFAAFFVWLWISAQKVRESRNLLSSVLDMAAVAVTDIDNRILYWSKGCETIFGWTAKEACGKTRNALTGAEPPTINNERMLQCPYHESGGNELRKDGTSIHIRQTRQILQTIYDERPYNVLNLKDCTVYERVEDARRKFNSNLKGIGLKDISLLFHNPDALGLSGDSGTAHPDAHHDISSGEIAVASSFDLHDENPKQSRMKELYDHILHASRVSAMGDIGMGLAHELNQPLTSTANYLAAMLIYIDKGSSSDKLRNILVQANEEVLRAGEIVRRMRTYVTRGELDFRITPLSDLIEEALQLIFSRSQPGKIAIRYQRDSHSPSILADHIYIQQLLVNLISNAIHTLTMNKTENPTITISTKEMPDNAIRVRVTDNGPGLPDELIANPTSGFFSTRETGMGIGLSICRRIVEGHGGIMSLSNNPKGGAIVEFTLPVYLDIDGTTKK